MCTHALRIKSLVSAVFILFFTLMRHVCTPRSMNQTVCRGRCKFNKPIWAAINVRIDWERHQTNKIKKKACECHCRVCYAIEIDHVCVPFVANYADAAVIFLRTTAIHIIIITAKLTNLLRTTYHTQTHVACHLWLLFINLINK